MRSSTLVFEAFAPILLLVSFGTTLVASENGPKESTTTAEQDNSDRLWVAIKESFTNPDVSSASPEYSTRDEDCGFYNPRLPKSIVPYHYELLQRPDLDTLEFGGAVRISVDINKRGDEMLEPEETQIVLHADETLKIDNVWYIDSGKQKDRDDRSKKFHWPWEKQKSRLATRRVKVVEICREPEMQYVVVTLAEQLQTGTYGNLYVTFSGKLSQVPRGFFSSPNRSPPAAIDNDGNANSTSSSQVSYVAATQFEAVEARKAFPCFDEPAMKATFTVSVIHPIDRIALSNTELAEERVLPAYEHFKWPEKKLTRFAQTPVMSTYLLAFIVGEFKFIERSATLSLFGLKRKRSVPVRIYMAPDEPSEQAEASLELATKALELATRYFDFDYPLNKLDLVPLRNFEFDSMENWGLIVGRRELLVIDKAETNPYHRAMFLSNIVHEIVHQWAGNLVTMDWWDDIWLSEGLATYFGYKFSKMLIAGYNYDFRYLLYSHRVALIKDSITLHPHAVQAKNVETVEQIEGVFDEISYNKAASVLRTLEHEMMLGSNFREGIRRYFKRLAYKTATTSDFVEIMRRSSLGRSKEVVSYLNTVLRQPGVPLVEVSYDESEREILLVQRRFVNKQNSYYLRSHDQDWNVPISVIFCDGTSQLTWYGLNSEQPNIVPSWFQMGKPGHWIKVNAGFSGYYRVDYEPELLAALEGAVRSKKLTPADRLNLIEDYAALMTTDESRPVNLLRLLTWFEDEDDSAVLDSLVGAFEELWKLYHVSHPMRPRLEQFGKAFFGRIKSKFGFAVPTIPMPDDKKQFQQLVKRTRSSKPRSQTPANINRSISSNRDFGRSASSPISPVSVSNTHSDSDMVDRQTNKDTMTKTQFPLEGYAEVLKMLVYMGHTETIDEAINLFETSEHNKVDPYLRTPVYIAVARHGSDSQFERLFELFGASDNSEESSRLANAIAHANKLCRLDYVWHWLKSLKALRFKTHEMLNLPRIMASSFEGHIGFRNLLVQNMGELLELLEVEPFLDLASDICLAAALPEYELLDRFLLDRMQYWRRCSQHVREISEWNMKLREVNAKEVETIIEQYLDRPIE